MTVHVDLDALLVALAWMDGGEQAGVDAQAYVDKRDGQVLWDGEGSADDIPDDIEDEDLYAALPSRRDFDLGSALVSEFVDEHLPDAAARVEGFFRKSGAYGRFKALLEGEGKLQQWYDYEQAATQERVKAWCVENGLETSKGGA